MAAIAQLGERQTEDLEVPSSILGHGISFLPQLWLPKFRKTGLEDNISSKLSAAFACFLLLFAASCCLLLLFAAFGCFLLLLLLHAAGC